MGMFSKLFSFGRKQQRQAPTQKAEARARLEEKTRTANARGQGIMERVNQRRQQSQAGTQPMSIQERIANDRKRGFMPTGIIEDERDVDPWHHVGSTGVSTVNPEEVGDALDREDMQTFLAGEFTIMADSSNVRYIKYIPEMQELEVGYKASGRRGDSAYRYASVTVEEAALAFIATSKGGYVWDVLRQRGTRYGHKKPYWRVA